MSATEFVLGISALADRFDGFILDQWGVLHDGRRPYPGVLETLAMLKQRRKRLVLLSNSGRRADFSRRHLATLGFEVGMFESIVTSGETTFRIVTERTVPPFDRLGKRCFLVTRDGDRTVLDGSDAVMVEDIEDADFLLLAGVDSPSLEPDDYQPLLEEAARRNIQAICSNPDLQAPTDTGLVFAPGLLAVRYEAMGGRVFYVGKPYAPVYRACLEALPGLGPEKLLAVGDSLDHDIKGANGMGITSAFVTAGLHGEMFTAPFDERVAAASLAQLCVQFGARPDFALQRFSW